MIVVIAAFPATENQKDGMVQRVAQIDSLMTSIPRIYVDISFTRFFRKQELTLGYARIFRLNFFKHAFLINKLIKSANLIYIHSAYNALKVIFYPKEAHVMFDAHGVVPEELEQEGKKISAQFYAISERYVLSRCNTVVCVTRAMLVHFKSKYGNRKGRDEIILPILPRVDNGESNTNLIHISRDPGSVIYAGGMQAWQNVDMMLAIAQAQPQLKYSFLTGDLTAFIDRMSKFTLPGAVCRSVPPEEVKKYYLKHEYGFILRDKVLVNEVACPTKLMEYLYWGVIPVVITPRIGDFNELTLGCITLDQFKQGEFPDNTKRATMRQQNLETVKSILELAQANQNRLSDIFKSYA